MVRNNSRAAQTFVGTLPGAAVAARRFRLRSSASMAGLALAGAALALPSSAYAQTLDLGGATVNRVDFDQTPGTPYASVQNGTLQLFDIANLTYAGSLQDGAGVFSLRKFGANVLTLTGTNNTYTGETRLAAGTLAAGAAGVFSANSVVNMQGGTLDIAGFNQVVAGLTSGGPIVNSGVNALLTLQVGTGVTNTFFGSLNQTAGNIGIFKTGAGEQILAGASTYAGGTALFAGQLTAANNQALGVGPVLFLGGTLGVSGTNINIGNELQLLTDGTFVRFGNPSALSGLITGAGRLTLAGSSGSVTISGNNNYTGGTTINGGGVVIGSNTAFGTGPVTVATVTTIGATGNRTLANAFVLNDEARFSPAGTLVLTGVVSGAGSLRMENAAGTLQLDGPNTYTGGTLLNGGTLAVGNSLSLGSGAILVTTASTLSSTVGGLVTANSIASRAALTVDTQGFGYTLSGAITDLGAPGSLIKQGAGTLTLAGVNGYSGDTDIRGGLVSVAADSGLGSTAGRVLINGGGLQVTGTANNATSRQFVLTGNGGAIEIVDGTNNYTIASVISGAGDLRKTGAGTLTLLGANTFAGSSIISAGTLAVGSNGALSTGSATFNASTLAAAASTTLANNIAFNGATIDTAAFNLTLNGVVGGTNFTKIGSGTLTLNNNANTVSSGLTVLNGTLAVGASGALGPNDLGMFGGTTLQAAANNLTLANNIVLVGGANTTFDTQANTLTLAGTVDFIGASPVVLDKVGSGTLIVAGNFTADPVDTINVNAGTLRLTGTIDNGALNVASGATLSGTGATTGSNITTIADGGILSPGTGIGNVGTLTFANLTLNPNSILNFDLGQAGTIGGSLNDLVVVGGALTLDGILNINAAPTFGTGNYTLLTYGSVIDNGLSLGSTPGGFTGAVVVGGGAVVLQSVGPAVQYWDGTGAIADGVISGGSGIWDSARFNWTDATGAFNTTWNNQQAIFQTVGGAVNVVGTQQFTRLVFAVNGYTLSGSSLNANAPGEISVTGGATTVIGNSITGGSITKQGTGVLVLNGANSFTDLGISAGTVRVGNNSGAGIGGISMASGTTLGSSVGGIVLGNAISTAGAGTIDSSTGLFTLNGPISGPGSITKVGAGNLVLNGNNSFTDLGIAAGTVTLGTNTAGGIGGISIGNGATLAAGVSGLAPGNAISTVGTGTIDSGAGVFTLGNTIFGPGSITKTGIGNLVLNGNNLFGDLGISAGTVTVGTNTAAGLGGISIGNGGTLAAGVSGLTLVNAMATAGAGTINSGPGVFTLNGPIAGPGSITKTGSGNLALNGNNSFVNLGISSGTVTVGTNTAAGVGGISMAGGTTLAAGVSGLVLGNAMSTAGAGTINSGAGIFTLNGPIAGPGSITKVGTGTLVLNGNNSFTNLGIGSGTVALGTNTAAGNGGISMAGGTTLAAATSGLVVTNAVSTAGAGTIDSGAGVLTLTGPIAGPGSITKIGSGSLALTGNNSFVNLGISTGTVVVGSNTAAGLGGISLANGTQLFAGGPGVVLANAISTAGAGRIGVNSGLFTLNGPISGPGSITKVGAGNLVLNGNNSFTDLGIAAGTVTLGTNTAGGIGGISIGNGATLAAGVSGLAPGNAISTVGTGTIDSGAGVFTLGNTIFGPGSITKTGIGNLVLNGNNLFGDLGISAGTVTVGTNTAAGLGGISIGNGGTLAAGVSGLTLVNAMATAGAGTINSGPGVFTLNGPIAGPGSITKTGSGNLALNGNNSFVNLGISSGTVTVGTNTAAGVGGISMAGGTTLAAGVSGLVLGNAMSTAGAGTINSGAGIFTLNGPIAGPGSITKVGTGTLVLNGNNSFTNLGISTGNVTVGSNTAAGNFGISMAGGTRLTAGVSGLVLANPLSTAGAGEIDSGSGTFTLSGPIIGAGSLTQVGTGTLVLTGNNSFANAGIKSGTLAVGSNTAAGAGGISINGGATLAAAANNLTLANAISTAGIGTVNTAGFDLTLAGAIVGPGSIVKTGAGTLTFTGVDTYAGSTTVTAGRLNVNGSLVTSPVTVASGGTLGGTGTIASFVAGSGSFVNPGVTTTPATLTVTGNGVFQAGSTFVVDVTPTTADRLSIGGTASLAGTLQVNTGAGFYNGTQYTILSAGGGRTGTFGTVSGFNAAFDPTVTYTANTVLLSIRPKSLGTLLGGNGTINTTNFANAFDAAVAAGFNPSGLAPLFGLGAGLNGALNQFTGELHSVERRVAMDDTRYVREAALDRLGMGLENIVGPRDAATSSSDRKVTLWGRGIGSWGSNNSDGNGSSFDKSSYGGMVGVDYSFDGGKVGVLGSYTQSTIDQYALGRSKVESTGGGVYAGYRKDHGLAAVIGGAAATVKARGSRSITVPGLEQNLASRNDGTVYQAFFDVSYDLAAGATSRFEPFVKFAWVALDTKAFTETGGNAALTSRSASYNTNVTTAGLRGSMAMGSFGGFALKASAGAQHTGGDRSPAAQLALAGTGSPAAIYATPVDKWALAAEVSGEFRLAPAATFAIGYSGVNGKRSHDNGVRGTLTFGF